ncbi:peptidoglycan recognition family protein [Pseudanabaena galeata UHCC 0370]|uniref:Peptidoglycan recognition family protein n=1 Tax=Pseudanabaena galeata UHCC 0370 TaxID=3110310 RepID=A0ABU5TFR9_9CYAN|nr:peptidoglycan recognition family protein [Pseudanabaena galeata]MEA5477142.1 peptidoglycan recognition family protein [Pseudanabaena galeata UHCC 0370]
MQSPKLAVISVFSLTLSISIVSIEQFRIKAIAKVPQPTPQLAPVFGCELLPSTNPPNTSPPAKLTDVPITLERFRRLLPNSTNSDATPKLINYTPKEEIALADASNYGDRYLKDLDGNPANLPPIIVLHETRESAESIISYFQEFHSDGNDQASYHTLIKIDGTIVYIVPPDKRAFGSGNSVFVTPLSQEAVQTNPKYASSVNNFAYHVSLETPVDVPPNVYFHSGYTNAQYQSLAWLVAKTSIPLERITTNGTVARSRFRIDPRSFNSFLFRKFLSAYPKTQEISIGCSPAQ